MKIITTVFLIIGVSSVCFATWGLFTVAGQRHFDEMAGIIPFAAMVLAFVMFGTGGLLFLLSNLRKPRVPTPPVG